MTASIETVWSDREHQAMPIIRSGQVFIDDGESISEAYVSYMAPRVALLLPEIDSAAITFQVQAEPNGAFVDLVDEAGNEVEIAASTGELAAVIPELGGWYAFKVRSGTSVSPVNQSPARTIAVQVSDLT